MDNKIYLCFHHHSDLVWRRTKQEYDNVREEQILYNLKFFDKYQNFRFCFAQANILKMFLSQHPELNGKIKKLISENKIEIVGGMISIPDTNLILGESIVRNILLGLDYYKKEFNKRPDIGWFMDAFGMNGQIPQILKKSGFSYLYPGRMPGLPNTSYIKGFVWIGIDGSNIITSSETTGVQDGTAVCNLPVIYNFSERMDWSLTQMKNLTENIFALYCKEEGFFEESIFSKIEKFNKENEGKIVISQPSDYYSNLNNKNLPEYKGEFNPEFSGCYTTRINIKQLNRKAEISILNAEKIAAIISINQGLSYPNEFFNSLWENLSICQFHDGICGCHIDAVYNDLTKDFEDIINKSLKYTGYALGTLFSSGKQVEKESIILFNTNPWPRKELIFLEDRQEPIHFMSSMPSFGYKQISISQRSSKLKVINKKETLEKYSFENENYKVSIAGSEISINPKFLKQPVFSKNGFGEILFREDAGDLWREEFLGPIMGKENEIEQIKEIRESDLFTDILIEGEVNKGFYWKGMEKLSWEKRYIFPKELKKFEMKLKIKWQGKNTKIMIVFPLMTDPLQSIPLYEIPFGFIERAPYFEVETKYEKTLKLLPDNVYQTAKGDWPALTWVDYSDNHVGLTVANKGTPAHQLNNGRIYVALMRSPTRPASGFYPELGTFENGAHFYEFAFLPHITGDLVDSIKMGHDFNNPPIIIENPKISEEEKSFISIEGEGIILSCFKKSEKEQGYILRLFESLGRKNNIKIQLSFPVKKIYEVNLIEENKKEIDGEQIQFSPFEIKTFLCLI
jgi:alpha-mannosidase